MARPYIRQRKSKPAQRILLRASTKNTFSSAVEVGKITKTGRTAPTPQNSYDGAIP